MIRYVKEKDDIIFREISLKDIVLNPTLRDLCKSNQCGQYGTNWMCPPGVGTSEELTSELQSCSDGILMQMIFQMDKSNDIKGWMKAFKIYDQKLENVINNITEHIPKSELLCLGAGPCRVCEECTMKKNEQCKYPDKAIASVEAYGIEVNPTVKNVGLTYNTGPNTVSYVAIILRR